MWCHVTWGARFTAPRTIAVSCHALVWFCSLERIWLWILLSSSLWNERCVLQLLVHPPLWHVICHAFWRCNLLRRLKLLLLLLQRLLIGISICAVFSEVRSRCCKCYWSRQCTIWRRVQVNDISFREGCIVHLAVHCTCDQGLWVKSALAVVLWDLHSHLNHDPCCVLWQCIPVQLQIPVLQGLWLGARDLQTTKVPCGPKPHMLLHLQASFFDNIRIVSVCSYAPSWTKSQFHGAEPPAALRSRSCALHFHISEATFPKSYHILQPKEKQSQIASVAHGRCPHD